MKHPMTENRVVITGMGAVTPIGIGVDEFWKALVAGTNGIARVTRFDVSEFRSSLAGEVKDFKPEHGLGRKAARRMDRFSQFALIASKMAYEDAGLDTFEFDPTRAGVIIGSGIGGSKGIEEGYDALGTRGQDGFP